MDDQNHHHNFHSGDPARQPTEFSVVGRSRSAGYCTPHPRERSPGITSERQYYQSPSGKAFQDVVDTAADLGGMSYNRVNRHNIDDMSIPPAADSDQLPDDDDNPFPIDPRSPIGAPGMPSFNHEEPRAATVAPPPTRVVVGYTPPAYYASLPIDQLNAILKNRAAHADGLFDTKVQETLYRILRQYSAALNAAINDTAPLTFIVTKEQRGMFKKYPQLKKRLSDMETKYYLRTSEGHAPVA
ncbi:hypothetical protein P154DRAFT_529441 [Amniculicola lignicola CBS 123094]|uniref:Uncharacterized protein n=1 Tax=Amniculicola lignicola CBS 123094 TaxID=1392246 RepID=A0A6A5X0Z9_9PLEO|nr:hypothetical protein P154DRAFT_529441 [Amniculicola lignicola CBS 123094]